MSGEVDYLLRVVVPDIEAYDAFYKRLIARIEIAKVSSAFAMEQIKYTTALPMQFARSNAGEPAPQMAMKNAESARQASAAIAHGGDGHRHSVNADSA